MNTWLLIAGIAGGYVAAVFTWDKLHTFIVGTEAKLLSLRDKAKALEQTVRGKL